MSKVPCLRICCALLFCLITGSLQAEVRTYQPGGVNNEWHNAANWSPNGLPASDDDLTVDVPGPSTSVLTRIDNGGSVLVTGSGTTAQFSSLYIGEQGVGMLTIEEGAVVNGDTVRMGINNSSSADAVVTGTGSAWDLASTLSVGYTNDSVATVSVLDGALLNSGLGLLVGANDTADGTLYVENSTVTTTGFTDIGLRSTGLLELAVDATFTSTNLLRVGHLDTGEGTVLVDDSTMTFQSIGLGRLGKGTLDVSGGSVITLTGSGTAVDVLNLGEGVGGAGELFLSGTGTLLDATNQDANIGKRGQGTLEILAGAELRTKDGVVGRDSPSGNGTALVSGTGSQWKASNNLIVGFAGTGSLEVLDSGRVEAAFVSVGPAAGGSGLLVVSGANSEVVVTGSSFFYVGVGSSVQPGGPGSVELSNGGKVVAKNAFLGPEGILEGSGVLASPDANGNSLSNGGTVRPGLSAGKLVIEGSYHQQAEGTLEIEIGGTTAETDYDVLDVLFNANLDGMLKLELINGFTPQPTDAFTILDADQVLGSFANAASGGLAFTSDGIGYFTINYGIGSPFDPSDVVLSDYALVDVDLDNDNDVDGADFLALQRDEPGLIPAWRLQYGSTTSLAASQAVPEPATLLLAFAVVIVQTRWPSPSRRRE